MLRRNGLRSPFVSLDRAELDPKNIGEINFSKPQCDTFALDPAGDMSIQC